ncbi:multiubiquitin domain-containing protein [Cryobacterium fucosi]|uniref:Multi-ubiquitin domain-containing protein n=1 Tax=Cryobacterium fucosi TaxID=1259157 RepID=A0A4R9BA64_9MICO|nr:multiubiquitin domain-containing protein [Cryobacterium fucosi]TFD79410.1 hypothetical protein E3T48_05645 [Cryobacterium fucosi]
MSENEKRKLIHFTIDGKEYTTRDDHQEAASLLRLAGVDPSQYDLARKKKDGETKTINDGKVVEINDGDAFFTVRQNATVG